MSKLLITQGSDLCIHGGNLCCAVLSDGFKAGGIMLLQVRVEECLERGPRLIIFQCRLITLIQKEKALIYRQQLSRGLLKDIRRFGRY
jgi:hypothetical protein